MQAIDVCGGPGRPKSFLADTGAAQKRSKDSQAWERRMPCYVPSFEPFIVATPASNRNISKSAQIGCSRHGRVPRGKNANPRRRARAVDHPRTQRSSPWAPIASFFRMTTPTRITPKAENSWIPYRSVRATVARSPTTTPRRCTCFRRAPESTDPSTSTPLLSR